MRRFAPSGRASRRSPSPVEQHGSTPPDRAGAGSCAICGTPLPPDPSFGGPDRLHGVGGIFTVHVCPGCGAGNTRPEATDEELAPYYPAVYGPHAGAGSAIAARLQSLLARRDLRVGAAGALRRIEPGRLLDVGCGAGILDALLIAAGWRADGLEPSSTACEQAAARGVRASEGTLSTAAIEEGAYDAVVFNHSLEHIGDPTAALAKARGALAPGGMVAVSVPNFGCWASRRFGPDWFHLDLPRHRVHYRERSLRLGLEATGFEDVRIWTSTSPTGLIGSAQYRSTGGLVVSEGMGREIVGALAGLGMIPFAQLEQGLGGGRDFLHAVARRPLE
jgi:SAM-dependent methyltransferase